MEWKIKGADPKGKMIIQLFPTEQVEDIKKEYRKPEEKSQLKIGKENIRAPR